MKIKKERPEYNGWVVFIFVISFLGADDWFFISAILLLIIYVGWIQYLQMSYDVMTE